MVKKVIIRILLIFMGLAFLAVALMQWLWIKYVMEEKQNRFAAQVYDVLNRTVNRIDEINYVKYLNEMQLQLGEIQNYNELISSVDSSKAPGMSSVYLVNFLHNDINRSKTERSYLSVQNMTFSRSGQEKIMNREFIVQAIRSIEFSQGKNTTATNPLLAFNEKLKEFMIRIIKERDPQNVSIQKRLEKVDMRELLSAYFRGSNIRLPFTYEILTKKGVLEKVRNKKVENFYYVSLFPNDYFPKDYYLGVSFDTIQPLMLENMGWLFLASGFCIFGLLSVFIATILIIMRQQKLSVIKNDFINNMTHEFKTPIATISLATSAISKDKVLSDKKEVLKFNALIKSENDRMNQYVERILQQARMDRRELPLNKKETDIHKLITEAIGHFRLQVQEKGGNLVTRFEVADFFLCVDEIHMMNVICNLVDNAIKYSPEAPEIEIYTRRSEEHFIIGVKDQGIGISREAQKKVFERFYRVSSGNLHNVKGFGLGLNYVKTIVELHNGRVRLTSRKNKGTLVEIIFKAELPS